MSTFARPMTLRPSGRVAGGIAAGFAAGSLLLALTIVAPGSGGDGGAASADLAVPAERSAALLPVRHIADRGERPRRLDPAAEGTRHRFLMMLYLQAGSREGIWSRR